MVTIRHNDRHPAALDTPYDWPECILALAKVTDAALSATEMGQEPFMVWHRARDDGQEIIERGVQNAGPHQEVHLQAVSHTFCLTVLAVLDGLHAEKDIELELDRYCGGLITSGPLLAAPTDNCARSLDPKIDRRGRKISYDEIAECYRVSRVTVAVWEKTALAKMRRRMPD